MESNLLNLSFPRAIIRNIFYFLFFCGLIQAAAYYLLDIPYFNRIATEEINRYLKPRLNLSMSFSSFSVNLFKTSVTLKTVKITSTSESNLISQTDLEEIQIKVAPLSSYFKKEIVVSSVVVSGFTLKWDADESGKIKLPSFLTSDSTPSHLSFVGVLEKIYETIPNQVRFNQFRIQMLSKSGKWKSELEVESIFWTKHLKKRDSPARLGVSVLGFHFDSNMLNEYISGASDAETWVKIKRSSLHASSDLKGNVVLNQGNFFSNLGEINLQGSGFVGALSKDSELKLRLTLECNLGEVGKLLKQNLTGKLNSTINVQYLPNQPSEKNPWVVNGKLDWQDVNYDGYQFYKGNLRIGSKLGKIQILHGNISNAKSESLVKFKGGVSLKNGLDFDITTEVDNLPFSMLMGSLNIPTADIIEFGISSSRLSIKGAIPQWTVSKFKMLVSGAAQIQNLVVPAVHKPDAIPIPNCFVEAIIMIDFDKVGFDGSQAECYKSFEEKKTFVEVEKGRIELSDSTTYFKLRSDQVNAIHFSYFLGVPFEGIGYLDGEITAPKGENVKWKSNTYLENGSLYKIPYQSLEGEWSIDGSGVYGKDVVVVPFSTSQTNTLETFVNLESFSVWFSGLETEFNGFAEGKLGSILTSFSSYIPQRVVEILDLTIDKITFFQRGPIVEPTKWHTKIALNGHDVKLLQFKLGRMDLSFDCIDVTCYQTKLMLYPDLKKSELKTSVFEATLDEISAKSLSGTFYVHKFPIFSLFPQLSSKISGLLSGNLEVKALDEKLWAVGSFFVPDLVLEEHSLGPTFLGVDTVPQVGVVAKLDSLQGALQAKMELADLEKSPVHVFSSLNQIDLLYFSKQLKMGKQDLFGNISATADFILPSVEEMLENVDSFQKKLSGEIEFISSEANYKGIRIFTKEKLRLLYKDSKIELKSGNIYTDLGVLETKGSYDLLSSELFASLHSKLNLKYLTQVSPQITNANGDLEIDLNFKKTDENLDILGDINLSQGSLNIKSFNPAITKMEAQIKVANGIAEVRRLHGTLGTGTIDAIGTIGWRDFLNSKSEGGGVPMSIKVELDGALFRFKAPLFDSAELTTTGLVQIVGQKPPYLIAGNLKFDHGRFSNSNTCQNLIKSLPPIEQKTFVDRSTPFANINIQLIAEDSIKIHSGCLNGTLYSNLRLVGDTTKYNLQGDMGFRTGKIFFLKSIFEIQKASLFFENPVYIEPRVDLLMFSKIESYNVFAQVEGVVGKNKVTLWSDPNVSSSGNLLSRADIFGMIASGQAPQGSNATNVGSGSALATHIAGYIYEATTLDESLSQTMARVTGGFIDNVQLQPLIENGQTRWRARVKRSLGERLNLGLDLDQGVGQNLTGTYILNDTVNFQGGYERNTGIGGFSEFSGGFRFQFGN